MGGKKRSKKTVPSSEVMALEHLATSVETLAIDSCDEGEVKHQIIVEVDENQRMKHDCSSENLQEEGAFKLGLTTVTDATRTKSLQLFEKNILKCSKQIQQLTSEMNKLKILFHQTQLQKSFDEAAPLDLSDDLVAFLGGNNKTSDEVKRALQKYVTDHNLVLDDAATDTVFKPDLELKKLLGVKRSTKQLSVNDVHREVLKLHIKKDDPSLTE